MADAGAASAAVAPSRHAVKCLQLHRGRLPEGSAWPGSSADLQDSPQQADSKRHVGVSKACKLLPSQLRAADSAKGAAHQGCSCHGAKLL